MDHHTQRTAGHQIAAKHAGEENEDAANLKHEKARKILGGSINARA
jgi:hypothetical protein